MATAATSWPCPVCAGLLPSTLDGCPHCGLPAAWVHQLLALGYAVRQLHYGSVIGSLGKDQYRTIVAVTRQRQEEWTRLALAGRPVPSDTGLPIHSSCYRCRQACEPIARLCPHCGAPLATPEVRLLRYQTFLCRQVQEHVCAGRLTPAQAGLLLTETASNLVELRSRLGVTSPDW